MRRKIFETHKVVGERYWKAGVYSGREGGRCRLELAAFGWAATCFLPRILSPKKVWQAYGSGGYWLDVERAYAAYLYENHLNVLYGVQTDDSETEQRWSAFLPWNDWRHVRLSLYDRDGKKFWEQIRDDDKEGSSFKDGSYEKQKDAESKCPKRVFAFKDFDGEEIEVITMVIEREWLRGRGSFRWVSFFRKPMISRRLDLAFKKEVGQRKGSWKGGTLGHSAEISEGETHESAFRKYCLANGMTFLREVEGAH